MRKICPFDDAAFRVLLAASLFLILVGSRVALIGFAGSPVPYMDEWDGDWGALIRPWLDGTLTPDALTAPFNEHRIVFTRLLALALFNLSGYWDVTLQMIVNALLGAALLVFSAFALSRVLSGRWALAAILAPCLVNVAPLAFDNILLGFNTHFFLLPAFSLLALWLTVDSRAWSGRWAAGVLVGAASFFCMASGALTLLTVAATHGLQMACGRRSGLREGIAVAALCVATGVMLAFVPHVPDSDAFRARSLGEFLWAFRTLIEWPAGGVFGWLLPIPSALFCLKALADRPHLKDARWFNIAALAWVTAQIAAIAVGRAQGVTQSRYFDTLVLGLTIHFVSALWIVETKALGENLKIAGMALAAWVAILGVTLTHAARHLPRDIELWRETVEMGGEAVRFYLASGDPAWLDGRPGAAIPYPDAGRLRAYLDAPEARAGLPPELLSRPLPRNGVEALKRDVFRFSPAGFGLGAMTLFGALFWRWSQEVRRREAPETAALIERPCRAPA